MTDTLVGIGAVKAASEILGDKWTPQLLRHFINEGTLRFCHLQDLAEGINPRTLSARLDSLEAEGIVEKVQTSTSRCEYRLSQKGYDLVPVLQQMQTWSEKYGSTIC